MEEEKEKEYKSVVIEKIKVSDGINGHKLACRHYFNNGTMWTSQFRAIAESLRLLSYTEEKQ